MNKTEAKLKELGWTVTVVRIQKYEYWAKWGSSLIEVFKTEKAAYNWIAKEFKLDNLVSKDKVIGILNDLFGAEPLCQDLINLLESKKIAKKRRDSIFELKQAIIKLVEGE